MAKAVRPVPMCAKCSEALTDKANFCSNCGAPVNAAEPEGTLEVARRFAVGAATEAGQQAREVLKSESAQKIAGGAALGAAAATVIPFVTIGVGAVLGAGFIAYKRLLK